MKKEVEEAHTFFLFLCKKIILFIIVLKFQVNVRLCGMSIYLTKGFVRRVCILVVKKNYPLKMKMV
jgi:hypothetical protein